MMHIHSIRADELAHFAQVGTDPAHVDAVHAYLNRMFDLDTMRPEWCLVADDNGTWRARVAAWTLPRSPKPLDFVLLALPFEDQVLARDLLDRFVVAVRALGADDIGYVSDDPPQAPQWQYYAQECDALLTDAGWNVERVTDRWERRDGADVLPTGRLHYRTLAEVGEDAFVDVVERISLGSLDQRIGAERDEYGATEAARREFRDLQGMDYQPDWWDLAYTPEGELIGMVMPTGSPTFGTIGYIGVLPEQRGKGYVDELLARGTATLRRVRYERLVCDTDVGNAPMANAFRRANWSQFATRREYKLRASPVA